MKIITRTLVLAVAALALGLSSVTASAGGRHGGHHGGGHRGHNHGLFWGGVGLSIGLGNVWLGNGYYGAAPYRPYPYYYPGYVIAPPLAQRYAVAPAYSEPPAKPLPEPIFYPREGQSSAETETDRQDCNRWATTQPSALADASVFHRATLACMEGRGYTVR